MFGTDFDFMTKAWPSYVEKQIMIKTITIDGSRIHDIPSLYDEINRVLMKDVEWKLGQSLDALDDMFYGGYGEIRGNEKVRLVWKNFELNRKDLGSDLTRKFYEDKLKSPKIFNPELNKQRLAELETGKGKTYFEIILEIIAGHPNIELVAK